MAERLHTHKPRYGIRQRAMETGAPKRIQRKRSRGWRMPKGAVYVGRPSRYGNPFEVGEPVPAWARQRYGVQQVETAEEAVALFRRAVADEINRDEPSGEAAVDMIVELRGKDLACWCPLDQPCHADVLLELANLPDHP